MADLMQQARDQFEAEFKKTGVKGAAAVLRDIVTALHAAPEGSATHYHCAEGIHGTLSRLRRYAKQGDNKNSLQGQTMEEAAAFIERALAARPQGVR